MKSTKNKEIKQKTKEFLADRKNANNLVDIIALFESEEDGIILACMRALHQIFGYLIRERDMYFDLPPKDEQDFKDLDSAGRMKMWFRDRYNECRDRFFELLTHPNSNVQELALCTLMKLVESEANTPLKKISPKHIVFPSAFFQQILKHFLSDAVPLEDLIGRFQEYLEFDDVRYFTMKYVLAQLKEQNQQELNAVYLGNLHKLLLSLNMPKQKPSDVDALSKVFGRLPTADGVVKIASLKEHKKLFTTIWLQFLALKLPTSLYKKVLVELSDAVMPHMTSPLLLADFLTDSYNMGGAISLLALNGLFVLVNAFNLNYPDFFKKLYALFEPSVFHVKYRARFFFLADLFLTSSHLPGYLVAAFIKKLSRLALTAPPHGLMLLLPFVYNLVNRHPNCKALLHRPGGPTDLTNDPFIIEESDPMKCKALESSLWEIKTLQDHYYHTVSRDAKKINNPLDPKEIELSELLECSANELFHKETTKKMKTMPVTFDPPKGLFSSTEDRFSGLWLLE